ncbi:MAG: hypothetical protein HY062_09765 [Bacteroidetes bacterium]|nr:hypothetical protein [Bacteroidota bacterium]
MKKVILLAASLVTLSISANAQETPIKSKPGKEQHVKLTSEQRVQKNIDNLNAVVGLTDEQKAKVKELASTKVSKADAIRLKYKGQPEQKETAKQEIDAVQKEYRQSVKALLTPEQLEKLKAKHKEAKANGKPTNSADGVIDAND